MTVLALAHVAAGQRREPACTARSAGRCGNGSIPTARSTRCRLGRSPTASIPDLAGPGLARPSIPRCSVPTGSTTLMIRDLWAQAGDGARRAVVGNPPPVAARSRFALCASGRISGGGRNNKPDGTQILNPDALTIGFARRFATYKRATLLFSDVDRLKAILHAAGRPVQFIFCRQGPPRRPAGQGVHPAGELGDDDPRPGREHDLPGRIRYERGPLPGAGRGCLAEQPAPPAGGQRHQRHESRR